jgi:hypothetical protein
LPSRRMNRCVPTWCLRAGRVRPSAVHVLTTNSSNDSESDKPVIQNQPPHAWAKALRDAEAGYRLLVAFAWVALAASALLLPAVWAHNTDGRAARRDSLTRTDSLNQTDQDGKRSQP